MGPQNKIGHFAHHQKWLMQIPMLRVSLLVDWCSDPSQPLGIISGLKETFIKRHIVGRTNKAEMSLEAR